MTSSADKFIASGTDWTALHARLQEEPPKVQGEVFERLTQLYLQTHPEYRSQLRHVWRLREMPHRVREQLALPGTDEGIDLVAETREGKFWAIQCKFRSDTKKPLTYGELCNKIGLHPRSARYFLSVIQIYCKKRNLPPLQALVVNKKTGVPGEGYIGSGRSQKEHGEALKKVYSYNWPTKAPVF